MKIKAVVCMVLLGLGFAGYGQVQHVAGIQSMDVMYGKSAWGSCYAGGYVRYFTNKLYGKGMLFYEKGKDNEAGVSYLSAGADIYVAYNVFKLGEVFYFNGIAGVTASSDQQTNGGGNALGVSIPSTFKYGVLGGVELETFITQRWVFVVTGEQKLTVNGNFGSTRWFGLAGIRFNLH